MATNNYFLTINIDGKLQDLNKYSEKTKSDFKFALKKNYRNLDHWQEVKIYLSIEEKEVQEHIEAQGWKFINKNDFIRLLEKTQKVGEHKSDILADFIAYLKNPKLHTPTHQ